MGVIPPHIPKNNYKDYNIMNFITDMLDYFYTLFYNWNSLDIIILAIALYACYRWGHRAGIEAGKIEGVKEYKHKLFKH